MKPKNFTASNAVLNPPKGMSNCDPLPIFTEGSVCISKWKASLLERLRILITGNVWIWVFTGSGTQPPIAIEAKHPMWDKQWLKEHKLNKKKQEK